MTQHLFNTAVQTALESFCDEIVARAPNGVEGLLTGDKDKLGKTILRQDPEQFVCQYLVWPICRALNYDHVTEWYLDGYDGSADFYIRSTSTPILAEVKRFNHYKKAIRDLRDYLNHRTTTTSYGIATDGLSWIFFRAPMDRRRNPVVLEYASLREAAFDYLVDEGLVRPQLEGTRILRHSTIQPVAKVSYREYCRLRRRPRSDSARRFVRQFSPIILNRHLSHSHHDGSLSQYDSLEEEDKRETLADFDSSASESDKSEEADDTGLNDFM